MINLQHLALEAELRWQRVGEGLGEVLSSNPNEKKKTYTYPKKKNRTYLDLVFEKCF